MPPVVRAKVAIILGEYYNDVLRAKREINDSFKDLARPHDEYATVQPYKHTT